LGPYLLVCTLPLHWDEERGVEGKGREVTDRSHVSNFGFCHVAPLPPRLKCREKDEEIGLDFSMRHLEKLIHRSR